jgi:DNA-binding NtrC family response regulator
MGVSLGLAIASARSGSPPFERIHGLGWLVVAVVMLDLVLPRSTRPVARYAVLAGLVSAGAVAALLEREGLFPEPAFALVVTAGMLATGALHQILLAGRGHAVEGALSGMALVGLAIGLAYAWLDPFAAPWAIAIELLVAALLWFGHLAWVDLRWRSLRRVGIPVVVASGGCFLVTIALAPAHSLARSEVALVGLGCGILWWGLFSVSRRVSSRAAWGMPDRLSRAIEFAKRGLPGSTGLDEVAAAILGPLTEAFSDADTEPEMYTLEPPLRIGLGAGGRVSIRSGEAPDPIAAAIFAQHEHATLDAADLRARMVREPSIRALAESMQARSIGAIVPCGHEGHLEGLLSLPLGGRSEALSHVELEELGRLGDLAGAALGSVLAQRRSEMHVQRLIALHREAERRVALLEGEVEQLRGQCHVLGRGLAEDQSLHVAYSPSMRRVQTRAIELAPRNEPVLLVAPAGAPLLPVARFIHDRGPRWEAPFVVADCSAASPDQVMSLLFGSEDQRDAGWFHSATGGTLLLRDLPALSKPAQARLASALLQLHTRSAQDDADEMTPPRILATSRLPASELDRRHALDVDLARLLCGANLTIPPLRERREDVPSLVLLAIDRACRILAQDPVGIGQQAMEALVAHDWPGDVAELELIVGLAVSKVSTRTISLDDLPPLAWPDDGVEESLDGTYLEVERRLLERALRRSGGNKSEAARALGLKRTTFLDKLRRHGLDNRVPQSTGGSAVG